MQVSKLSESRSRPQLTVWPCPARWRHGEKKAFCYLSGKYLKIPSPCLHIFSQTSVLHGFCKVIVIASLDSLKCNVCHFLFENEKYSLFFSFHKSNIINPHTLNIRHLTTWTGEQNTWSVKSTWKCQSTLQLYWMFFLVDGHCLLNMCGVRSCYTAAEDSCF